MRSMSARALESTPGQLYCRRFEPATRKTRNGRAAVGRRPLASSGFIGGKRSAAAKVHAAGRALPRARRASACGHAIHKRQGRDRFAQCKTHGHVLTKDDLGKSPRRFGTLLPRLARTWRGFFVPHAGTSVIPGLAKGESAEPRLAAALVRGFSALRGVYHRAGRGRTCWRSPEQPNRSRGNRITRRRCTAQAWLFLTCECVLGNTSSLRPFGYGDSVSSLGLETPLPSKAASAAFFFARHQAARSPQRAPLGSQRSSERAARFLP